MPHEVLSDALTLLLADFIAQEASPEDIPSIIENIAEDLRRHVPMKRKLLLVKIAENDPINEICPRYFALMQATHHPLCQERDGTPTTLTDREVHAAIAQQAPHYKPPSDDELPF
jgi:hypothetical protein